MPGFSGIKAMVDAENSDGARHITTWRKTPAIVTAAGFWSDLSMAPGNPVPNYYASSPLVAVALKQSTDGGIWHSQAVLPAYKYLRRLLALTVTAGAVPLPMLLCDYLLYYPFVDEGSADEQFMTNATTLPRYTDGAGVQMMAVVVAPHTGLPGTLVVNYTSSDGVVGRTSQTVTFGGQLVNGTILTSAPATVGCRGPFIPLATGDKGVRSIESVTVGNGGDVGLFTLVLVKPLADISLRGIDAPVEVDFLRDRPSMPRIVDDAYLNFLCLAAGSLSAAPIHGTAEFSWA